MKAELGANMTKKTHTLYMSILPIILIVILIIGAGYLLTKGDIKILGLNDDTIEVTRVKGFPTTFTTNKLIEKQRSIIHNDKELETFLKTIDESGQLKVEDEINFDRVYLVGISSKTFATTGYETKVKKVYKNKEDNTITVLARELKPGDTCKVEQQPNITVDLVSISKTDKKIGFELIKEFDDCR